MDVYKKIKFLQNDTDHTYKEIKLNSQFAYTSCFSQNGKMLSVGQESTIYVYECIQYTLICQLKGHKQVVVCTKYFNNDINLMSCSDDKQIIIWNIILKQISYKIINAHDKCINSLDIAHKKNIFISASNSIKIWNLVNYNMIKLWSFGKSKVKAITQVRLSHNNTYFACTTLCNHKRRYIQFLNIFSTNKLQFLRKLKQNIEHFEYSYDDKHIITCGPNKIIKFMDSISLTNKYIIDPAHFFDVNLILIPQNQHFFISGDVSGKIKIWDIYNKKLIVEIQAHNQQISSMTLDMIKSQLITTSFDRQLRIWNINAYIQI